MELWSLVTSIVDDDVFATGAALAKIVVNDRNAIKIRNTAATSLIFVFVILIHVTLHIARPGGSTWI